MENEVNRHTGIISDILHLISEYSGIKFEPIHTNSWAKAVLLAKNNKIDMYSAIPYNKQRGQYMNFTKNDIFQYNASLVKSIYDTTDYKNLDISLIDKTIAIVKSSALGNFVKIKYPQAKYIEVEKTKDGFIKLQNGKVDLFAINSTTADYMINIKGFKSLNIASKLDYIFKLKIALSKDMPDKVLSIIDKTLNKIDKKEIDNIYNKWMNPVVVEYKTNWEIVKFLFLVIIIIVAFLAYRQYLLRKANSKLEKKVKEKTKELEKINNNLEDTVKIRTKELKEQKDRYQFAIDGSNDGIWDWNIITNDIYFSTRWKEMLGYRDSELPNEFNEWKKRVHKDDLLKVMEAIESNLNGNQNTFSIEHRLKHKNGDWVWVLDRTKTKYDTKGKAVRMSGFHTDITNQKKQAEQLLKSEKMAALEEMIGNIAHQWRQPLSVISTASSGIQLQKEHNMLTDERLNEFCEAINTNALYLSKTIDDFRDFIKGDRNKSLFILKDTVNSFLNLTEGSNKHDNINIVLDLKDDIIIKGYSSELIQCFINIFNNAKDILKEKEIVDKYFFINAVLKDNNAVITFKDNAGGIPEDILAKIFEPYFTTKHQSQGTGLGLHTTYKIIIDGMDGTIEVNNVTYEYEGKDYIGAELKISLPL